MRRLILKLMVIGGGITALCLGYGFFIEPKTLSIRHIEVNSEHWSKPPLKIVYMSDLHIGGWHVSPERVGKLVDLVNEASSDFIFLGGDYVDSHESRHERSAAANDVIDAGIAELSRLKAQHPVYAVIGNQNEDGRWQLRLWWKPFVTFIWYGGLLIAFGGVLSLIGRVRADLRRRRGEADESEEIAGAASKPEPEAQPA